MLPYSHLCRHDPLALGDEVALAAGAVPEAAVTLVALQPRDQPVVPAASALGPPTIATAATLLLCKAIKRFGRSLLHNYSMYAGK